MLEKEELIEKYIKANGFNIHYLEGGDGEAVVLLPSFGLTSKSYQQFGENLAQKYRVIIPDLGKGKSSGKKVLDSLSDYASLLNDFLKAIKINKFYLIGVSFGGLVAIEYYKKYPSKIRGLFLTSTTLTPIRKSALLKGYPHLLFKNLFTKNGLKVNLLWLFDGFTSSIRHPKQLLKDCSIGLNNVSKKLTELKISNILVFADKDEFIPFRKVQEMRKINGLKLKIIKGSHGWLFLNPEDFVNRVEKFLKRMK